MLDLSIVIVSYHVKDYLEKCLGSIYSNTEHLHFEILVVDNCSQDGSPEMVKRLYPEVRLIENGTNQGFSKANNQAIAQSKGRYILLLNPDTEIFAEALEKMVAYMDSHPSVGALGARTWSDPDKTFQWGDDKALTPAMLLYEFTFLGTLFQNNAVFQHNWQQDWRVFLGTAPHTVETINGHCQLIRRQTLHDVGLLDEAFFRYFSDLDWCMRARGKGWDLALLPEAEIIHYIGRSPLDTEAGKIFLAELKIYLNKHFGKMISYPLLAAMALNRLLAKATRPIGRGLNRIIRLFLPASRQPMLFDSPSNMILAWPESAAFQSYLLELSTSPLFLYKGAVRVKETCFTLPESFFYEWPDGDYYWRIIPLHDMDLKEGKSKIRKHQIAGGFTGTFQKKGGDLPAA